jgi:predicted RNase H-like HicB family nuclease
MRVDKCVNPHLNCKEHRKQKMKLKVIVHPAEEGGFWAEVPAIQGCATQGESIEELLKNVQEAIEGCLSVGMVEGVIGGHQSNPDLGFDSAEQSLIKITAPESTSQRRYQ